jgi:hypothetical protein
VLDVIFLLYILFNVLLNRTGMYRTSIKGKSYVSDSAKYYYRHNARNLRNKNRRALNGDPYNWQVQEPSFSLYNVSPNNYKYN